MPVSHPDPKQLCLIDDTDNIYQHNVHKTIQCYMFSLAVLPMNMGSLCDEDDIVKDTFKALLPSVFMPDVYQSTIMVTPAMVKLAIQVGNGQSER